MFEVNEKRGKKFDYLLLGLLEEQVEVSFWKTRDLTWTLALPLDWLVVNYKQKKFDDLSYVDFNLCYVLGKTRHTFFGDTGPWLRNVNSLTLCWNQHFLDELWNLLYSFNGII